MSGREPGWYWVRQPHQRDDWLPAEWNLSHGGVWFDHSGNIRQERDIIEIGPRILPPGEPDEAAVEDSNMTFRLLRDRATPPAASDLRERAIAFVAVLEGQQRKIESKSDRNWITDWLTQVFAAIRAEAESAPTWDDAVIEAAIRAGARGYKVVRCDSASGPYLEIQNSGYDTSWEMRLWLRPIARALASVKPQREG